MQNPVEEEDTAKGIQEKHCNAEGKRDAKTI